MNKNVNHLHTTIFKPCRLGWGLLWLSPMYLVPLEQLTSIKDCGSHSWSDRLKREDITSLAMIIWLFKGKEFSNEPMWQPMMEFYQYIFWIIQIFNWIQHHLPINFAVLFTQDLNLIHTTAQTMVCCLNFSSEVYFPILLKQKYQNVSPSVYFWKRSIAHHPCIFFWK